MKVLRNFLKHAITLASVLILASMAAGLVLAQRAPESGTLTPALAGQTSAFISPLPTPGAKFVTGGGWIDSPAGNDLGDDLIVNGSFETGDYTGWTLWEGGEVSYYPDAGTWGIAQDGQVANAGDLLYDYWDGIWNPVSTPAAPITFEASDGTYVAFNLQNGPQIHRMYQDISIPASCIMATLSWDMKYEIHNLDFTPAQHLSVHIRDTSDVIVETLFNTTQGVDPLAIPMTSFSRDLSAYAGTTVRLDVEADVRDAPLDVAFDHFVLGCDGAYKPDPTLGGKATFGFVSKYKKGADTPTGNVEFQFRPAGLNFHSSSYEWLVVTGGDYAMFEGNGTINGRGDYKFRVWAGDDKPDTFRIKIWEEDEFGVETVIYDNGSDQAIGGGSVVLHTKGK